MPARVSVSRASRVRRVLRTAFFVLEIYGQNSSLHGLYHIFQSKDGIRRTFWLIVLIGALGAGIWHTVASAKRYSELGVFVQIQDEAEYASFPDVTLCRMKPFSESLLLHYAKVLDRHFDTNWAYFDNWFLDERQRSPNETDVNYKLRLVNIFNRFLQIVWASEDFRDLGMFSDSTILSCSYEGRSCDYRNFTMIRDPDGWYCYSFSPSKSIEAGTDGLRLDLFSDTSFYHHVYDGSLISLYGVNTTLDTSDDAMEWNSFKLFLRTQKRSLNQIAIPKITQSNGFRVIFHKSGTHPMLTLDRLELESGVSASVNIGQTLIRRLQRKGVFDCTRSPHGQIRFVNNFDNDGNIEYRNYNKLQDEQVIEKKQQMMREACGCYSHRYPFQTDIESLCYHAPQTERRWPSHALLKQISCHDETVAEIDQLTFDLLAKYSQFAPCTSTTLGFYNNVYEWPKTEDITSIINDYVLQTLYQRDDMLPTDGQKHAILNFSDPEIVKLVGRENIVSRQTATLLQLLNGTETNDGTKSTFNRTHWRLDNNAKLSTNLLRLHIRLANTKSRLVEEHLSYLIPEALSEIGGVCGLWLGMCVLTCFELLEVVYLFFTANSDLQDGSESSSHRESAIQPSNAPVESEIL